ncbi:ROK family transcriptional regulator [Salinimonas chungwhensis]|uniref:ROK family transcriptional regulator n=1 Tax=Salinimonas chungwhensis TaxID=265425 RepID=UPI00035CD9D8|nr:ROK family transcriptional regulator [Salinimonas chungwhensis]
MGQQSGSNPSGVRRFNERLILSMLSKHGPLSKTELAQLTNLTKQAVVRIVDGLAEQGLLLMESKRISGKGRPSELYVLNPKGAYSIGVKVGRREIKMVLMDITGNIIGKVVDAYSYPEPGKVIDIVKSNLTDLMNMVQPDEQTRVKGLGVAMPWLLGGWSDGHEMPDSIARQWKEFDIQEALQACTELPVLVGNDCTSAAAAELLFGRGKKYNNYLYVYIDSFIGGGLVLNGNVEMGVNANSAAIASYPVSHSRATHLPRPQRTFEVLLNRASLMSLTDYLVDKGYEVENLAQLQRGIDSGAYAMDDWVDDCAHALAELVVGSNVLLDYNAVILDINLDGALMKTIISKTSDYVDELLERDIYKPELVEGLLGQDAMMVGAAILPFYSHFAADKSVLFKTGS